MRYKSCNLIQHGLCFYNEMLVSCCFSPNDQINGGFPPIICKNYHGELIDSDFLFKKIKEYNDVFKNGSCPKECLNCFKIEEKEWNEDHYINSITITHFSACNADCIYCSNNLEKNERTNNSYDILPVLNNLKEQNIIRQGVELHIGGGEFTIYKECDDLIDKFALSGFAKVFVPTNAICYSDKLHKALVKNTAAIVVSLDAGSRKTYKKIKNVDAFDIVVNNLRKYSSDLTEPEAISLKYIIIPTINDNYTEFSKFLSFAKKLNIKKVIIDVDARYSRLLNYNIDPYLINFVERIKNESLKRGFITETYSFYSQCSNNSLKDKNIIHDIYSFIRYKILSKKINYLYTSHLYGIKRVD